MKLKHAVATALVMGVSASQAAVLTWSSTLGPEVQGATGSGFTKVYFDDTDNTLRVTATFSGLSGLTTVAHIHCCTLDPFAGTVRVAVDTPTLAIPTGVTAGSFDQTLDLDLAGNWGADFLSINGGGTTSGAIAALRAGLDSGRAYLNIHTRMFPSGEIRGFLQVPEPASLALALSALGLLAGLRRGGGGSASPSAHRR